MLAILLASAAAASAQQAGERVAAPACRASQISVETDGEDGAFNGMSHSGALLVLQNISSAPCRIKPFPKILLKDKADKPLNVALSPADNPFDAPRVNGKPLPMGHGPVALPILLAIGAEATATLYWVAGTVFDHSVCVDVGSISVEIGAGQAHGSLAGHICGLDADHLEIKVSRLSASGSTAPR